MRLSPALTRAGFSKPSSGTATKATVQLQYKDAAGETKSVELDYSK